MNRANPHYHGIILEGCFDEDGNFVYLPVSDTKNMTELFRRLVIKFSRTGNLSMIILPEIYQPGRTVGFQLTIA